MRKQKSNKSNLKDYYSSTLLNLKLGTINAIIPNFLTFFILGLLISFFDIVRLITLDFIGVALRLFQAIGVVNSNLHLVSAYHVYLEKLFLIEKNKSNVDLDSFKNIKNPRIENGNLYFLYSEEHYPYATRLYSMGL